MAFHIAQDADSDVYLAVFESKHIDMAMARESVARRIELCGDKQIKVIIDATLVKSIAKEARDYLASEEASRNIKAAAIYCGSLMAKIIGGFFVAYSRPAVPMKLFTDTSEARRWLAQF